MSAYHVPPSGIAVTVLGTAVLECVNKDGALIKGRALIDTGSTLNMVTEEFAEKLKFKLKPCQYQINTVGNNTPQKSKGTVDFYINTNDGERVSVHAQVLPQCTGKLPIAKIDIKKIPEIVGKQLADPVFHTPNPVDMILGIELFNTLMLDTRMRCGKIVLSETRVGWMISGVAELADAGISAHMSPFNHPPALHANGTELLTPCSYSAIGERPILLDQDIIKFWQVEDLPGNNLLAKPEKDYTPEEKFAADHYTRTTVVNAEGKYVVQLPRKPVSLTGGVELVLGNSKPRALRSQLAMEKRFDKSQDTFKDYLGL